MHVAALFCYPVKSCGALALERARLEPAGLERDRRYAFVGEDGRLLTQRELPRLGSIRPVLEEERLLLDLAGLARIPAAGCEHAVSDFLGVAVRLVPGEFPDVAPVLLTALATLGELDLGVTMERFRPNVVLAGSRPREELEWTRIETRAAALECEAPCERCEVIGAEALRAVRRALGGHFGVYCRVARPGPLARGESVTCA